MKTFTTVCIGLVCLLPSAKCDAQISAHPLRSSRGQVMDFSQAIRWYQNDPNRTRHGSYGVGSPLYQDWERRKKASDMEGQKWRRYLLEGSVIERRPEGAIISVNITKTIQDGVFHQYPGWTGPAYKTISTTKEVLLKNAPERLQVPVFAFPLGMATVGTVTLEAYDYGTPVAYAKPAPQLPTHVPASESAASQRTNAASSPTRANRVATVGMTSVVVDGEELRGITRVVLGANGKVSIICPTRGSSVSVEKLPPEFLQSWGITTGNSAPP